METFRLAPAPKFAGMMSFDCSDCGHPELGRPVFLAGPAGVAAYGTGCAARLLGLARTELEATVATNRLIDAAHDRPEQIATAWAWFSMSLPGRVTPKFVAEAAARSRLDADTMALVVDTYKARAKAGTVRQLAASFLAAS